MPELPEVETVVRGLKSLLINHKIIKIDSDWSKGFIASNLALKKFVIGSIIDDIYRRGKAIVLVLRSNYLLVIHLKMTGQLIYVKSVKNSETLRYGAGHPSDSFINSLPDSSTRIIFKLDKGGILYFNDMRKFGWVKLIKKDDFTKDQYINNLGPDILDISKEDFIRIIGSRKKKIKVCLLDQGLVSGCGNIYADEALWLSEIAPYTLANELSKEQLIKLLKSLKEVMHLSISQGGSSTKNYVNAKGEKGKYLEDAYVYQKSGHPCRRCKNLITRIVIAGRGTHICEVCQR